MRILAACALMVPLLLAAPEARAAASPFTFHAGDEIVAGAGEGAMYRSCQRKARRAYGPVRGRHSSSLRIAAINQCVSLGGRLP